MVVVGMNCPWPHRLTKARIAPAPALIFMAGVEIAKELAELRDTAMVVAVFPEKP